MSCLFNKNRVKPINGCTLCGFNSNKVKYFKYPCSNKECAVKYKMCPDCSIKSYKRKQYEYDEWDGDGMYDVIPKCPFCNKEDYYPIYNTLIEFNKELNEIDKPVKQCMKQPKYNYMPIWRNKFNQFCNKNNKSKYKLNNFKCNKVDYNDIPLFPIRDTFDINGLDYDYFKGKYTRLFHNNESMRIKEWHDRVQPELIKFQLILDHDNMYGGNRLLYKNRHKKYTKNNRRNRNKGRNRTNRRKKYG